MTAHERRNYNQTVYRKKYRSEMLWREKMVRRYGKKWWLRLAFIKAGGRAEDWPIVKQRRVY